MTHEQYQRQKTQKPSTGQQSQQQDLQCGMWGKRTQEGFQYSIHVKLPDGLSFWVNLEENPYKRAGDKRPDFIEVSRSLK